MSGRAVWRVPALLGVGTAVGLSVALFGDGWWDWLGAAALAAPVAAAGWYGLRRPRV